MAATQSYQVQGITGGEVAVPPGVSRPSTPCYMPEWLETIRTSRMGIIAVASVPDPKGKSPLPGRGDHRLHHHDDGRALLKVSADDPGTDRAGGPAVRVPLKVPAGQAGRAGRAGAEDAHRADGPRRVGAGGRPRRHQKPRTFASRRPPRCRGCARRSAARRVRTQVPAISEATVSVEFLAGGPGNR